jgi:hypothetical protein
MRSEDFSRALKAHLEGVAETAPIEFSNGVELGPAPEITRVSFPVRAKTARRR